MFMEPEKPKPGLSPPQGLRRGRGCLFSYLGDFTQHLFTSPQSCSPVGEWGAGQQEADSSEVGRGIKARGLAPPQRSHESSSPARKRALKEKGPGQWVRAQYLRAPSSTPCQPVYLFAFLPSSPDGKPGQVAQWNIVPHLSDHCLLPSLCSIHPFLPCSLS